MEKSTPIILSMFEAYKAKLKIELSRKATLEDLEDLEARLMNSERLLNIEARVSQLEVKMREFEFTHDEDDEEYDEIDSQHLDDIEVSVEKERKRNRSANSQSFKTEEGVPERMNTNSIESMESSMQPQSIYKSRGTIGSPKLSSKGGSKRHLLMLARDLSSANDKIDKLTLDFGATGRDLDKVRGDIEELLMQYGSMQLISESLKKESMHMNQQNENLQRVLEEASSKTKQMKEEVKGALEEFRIENGKHLSRLVMLETEQGALRNEAMTFRKKLQRKFDESIEFMKKINDQTDRLFKDMKGLKGSLNISESSTLQEVASMKRELMMLKGPLQDFLLVKGKESEILSEEVKRHQDLFRKMAEEYITILDVKMRSPQDSTQRTSLQFEEVLRLKQENAHLRASTASPSVAHQLPNVVSSPSGRLRFSKTNFDWGKLSQREGSLKAVSRPKSRIESLNSSYRETPRKLNITIKR
mmetsp:Transcript_9338/g.17913  ORF Transcript_9338/g.17913 Transcript_9338/m.17913 type:complete len:473 (+) Transcript_9338:4781-6199(+)